MPFFDDLAIIFEMNSIIYGVKQHNPNILES